MSEGHLSRRRTVFQWLQRNVSAGLSLREFARLLDHPAWLHDDAVWVVEDRGGHIPVGLSTDTTVVVIEVLSEPDTDHWQVYLRMGAVVTRADFMHCVVGDNCDAAGDVVIIEVGFRPSAETAHDA